MVNAPYYSATLDLQKNTQMGIEAPCVELTGSDGVLYRDCQIETNTDITFSFVLTSVEDSMAGGHAADTGVSLTRGAYSSAILQSLQALFQHEARSAWKAICSQIYSSNLARRTFVTVEKAPVATATRGGHVCGSGEEHVNAMGYDLTFRDTSPAGASAGRENDSSQYLDISKRVVDSK